jgi:predicted ATPase
LREQIKDTLSHDLHHDLHRHVAVALETLYPDEPENASMLAHHWAVAGDQDKELYYSVIAGYQAAQNSANIEATRLLERALELLSAQPPTPERDRQELEVQIALGPLLFTMRGYSAPEVNRTYARANELAAQTGQIDLLFHATWGQWMYYRVVDLDIAQELVSQLFRLAELSQDDSLLLEAHHSGWATEGARGDAAAMHKHIEHGLRLYDPVLHRDHVRFYGHDPGACASLNEGYSLWLLGYPDQAREGVLKSVEMAEEIGHPYSLANSFWGQALVHYLRGEYRETLAQAENLFAYSQDHDFSTLTTAADWFKAASLVGVGQIFEGMAQMRELLEASLSQKGHGGWRINFSNFLEASLTSGSPNEGLQAIKRASNQLKNPGHQQFDSEIQRLHGELILAKDTRRALEAERHFQLAIDIARQQSAKSLELRATMSLARLWRQMGKREKAHQILLIAARDLIRELK